MAPRAGILHPCIRSGGGEEKGDGHFRISDLVKNLYGADIQHLW